MAIAIHKIIDSIESTDDLRNFGKYVNTHLGPNEQLDQNVIEFFSVIGNCLCKAGYSLKKQKNVLHDIMNGGHYVIADPKLYDFLVKHLKELDTRISSHQSDKQQYGFTSSLGAMLFGSRNNQFWFQLEGYPVKLSQPSSLIMHGLHYLEYKITGKNISLFGKSKRTESHPKTIHFKEKNQLYSNNQLKNCINKPNKQKKNKEKNTLLKKVYEQHHKSLFIHEHTIEIKKIDEINIKEKIPVN